MTIIRQISEKIQKSKRISLFFHQLPDPDTLGSCFGLRALIKKNFPNVDVRIVDYDLVRPEQRIPFFQTITSDETNEEWIKESLGIVLDTANSPRVFAQKFRSCYDLIRIDHHPKIEIIGSLEWVDDRYSSTCEMVTQMAKVLKWTPTAEALNCLYFGMLTDTNRFMYPSSTPRTYELVSWMLKNGLNRELVHNDLYLRDWEDMKNDFEILKMVKIDADGIASLFLDKEQNARFGQKTFSSKVNLMAGFKQIKIWTSLYWDEINNQWKGSIRSRDYIINDVAAKFGGGGHRLASGFKLENPGDYELVLAELRKKIHGQ